MIVKKDHPAAIAGLTRLTCFVATDHKLETTLEVKKSIRYVDRIWQQASSSTVGKLRSPLLKTGAAETLPRLPNFVQLFVDEA